MRPISLLSQYLTICKEFQCTVYFISAIYLGIICISIHVVIIVMVDSGGSPSLLYDPAICSSILGEYWLEGTRRFYTWLCCLQYHDASAPPGLIQGIDFSKLHDHCNSSHSYFHVCNFWITHSRPVTLLTLFVTNAFIIYTQLLECITINHM